MKTAVLLSLGLFLTFFLVFLSLGAKPAFAQECDPTCYFCGTWNDCGDWCGDCSEGECGNGYCEPGVGEDCYNCSDCGPTGSCEARDYNQCTANPCESETIRQYSDSCGNCAWMTLSTQYDAGCCGGISCSAWGGCSASCGGGTQMRGCYDPATGDSWVEWQDCNTDPCGCSPGPTSCGGWADCSVSCGGGIQARVCDDGCDTWTETQTCNSDPCPAPECTLDQCEVIPGCNCTERPDICDVCSGWQDCGETGITCSDGKKPHTYCTPACPPGASRCYDTPACPPAGNCNDLGGNSYCEGLPGGGCWDPSCPGTAVCGSGGNCYTDCSDCSTPSHLGCGGADGKTCISISGPGSNTCASNADCGGGYHFECDTGNCTTVAGAGSNQCASDSECAPAPSGCSGIIYSLFPASPVITNTSVTVNISRAVATSCKGNWDWTGLRLDGVSQTLQLCFADGSNCAQGYHATINSDGAGSHSLQLTVNTPPNDPGPICYCNSTTFQTLAVPSPSPTPSPASAWIQVDGDVHSNTGIDTPRGPGP